MKEASLWDYLRKLLPKGGHYSRIESDTSHGFPDVHFTFEGVTGTIELKSTKRPGAKYPFSGKDGLRRSQLNWIQDEIEVLGWVILCLQVGEYVYLLKAALYYDDLHKMTLEDITRASGMNWSKRLSSRETITERLSDFLPERD